MHEDSRTKVDLAAMGWDEGRGRELAALGDERLAPARCMRVDRGSALVLGIGGPARVSTRQPLATGDWLALEGERVGHRLERRTEIARRSAGRTGGRQTLAANVDVLLVVCGLDRPVRVGRLQRSIAIARSGGAEARLVLTKADLHPDPEALAAALGASLDVPVLAVSAAQGAGVEGLRSLAAPDRTLALIGESGAGKSTLVNAVAGTDRATGAVRGADAKGRHTTTARELIPLSGGGALLDTPGLREVGLVDVGGVEAAFADLLAVAGACRFRDCRHEGEPGCAVRAAVDAGALEAADLDRLIAMRREAEAAELRADEHERRRHERRFARVVRDAQHRKRGRRPR